MKKRPSHKFGTIALIFTNKASCYPKRSGESNQPITFTFIKESGAKKLVPQKTCQAANPIPGFTFQKQGLIFGQKYNAIEINLSNFMIHL